MVSELFRELCQACRKGDIELVEEYISRGVNLNQMDEWDYSPLILASICGHEDLVRLLLEKGSVVNRDTFEGSRAIYGALTDSIRSLLLSYDITKAVDLTQPFASHISSLLQKPGFVSADVAVCTGDDIFRLHRFMLAATSPYFRSHNPETELIAHNHRSLEYLFNYIYLVPNFDLKDVDQTDLFALSSLVGLDELEESVLTISSQTSVADAQRAKNKLQHVMFENARSKFKLFVQDVIFAKKLTLESQDAISANQKLDLIKDSNADLVLAVGSDDCCTFYPVHRAILARSEYYQTLFNSSFQDTSVFQDLLDPELQIIDWNKFTEDPESIPVVSLPSSDLLVDSVEVTEILIGFLYFDDAEVPPEYAMEVLMLADSLFIERLKTMASISLSAIEDFDTTSISIYEILKAAWEFRVHRLETRVAYLIAQDLQRFAADPEFKDIILQSSQRIEARQDYDTIELIDDIRFYLAKKYAIDNEGGTLDPTMTKVESDEYLDRVRQYEADLERIDNLLVELELNA